MGLDSDGACVLRRRHCGVIGTRQGHGGGSSAARACSLRGAKRCNFSGWGSPKSKCRRRDRRLELLLVFDRLWDHLSLAAVRISSEQAVRAGWIAPVMARPAAWGMAD